MSLAVGDVALGIVSNLTKFGAFVNLDDGASGLVHISEISDSYVENVSDFLEKGQKVKVKVISIDDKGKVSLSIKAAMEKKPPEIHFTKPDLNASFEDKLSKFLKDSNEKLEQARSREKQKTKSNRSRNRF
ncbi:S1 RNA-binding domain-containing protein [Peptoniphilus raoultii]|uniref:S1 RNA-binding domain-containing protein n=1 Tax=Peptoniphilus raoultii TaxID=1776387 RepID=UPI0008D9B9BD|nr:S1 RNA-binding domain-containing protein [Peptoniphilus raoultii]